MKKIYYLFTFVAVIAAFSSCKPLSKTYDTLGDVPAPVIPPQPTPATLTLSAADYGLLPATNYAKTTNYFKTIDDAKAGVPAILAAKYPTAADKASIAITYAFGPATIKLADSTLAITTVALQTTPTDDYKFPSFTYNGATIAANNFDDLSATVVINWLRYKYPTPAENSLRVLTYLYFESNVTASTGTLTTDAFLYTAATDWVKIYRVNNTQYTSVNRGTNFAFVSSDAANLPTYFNNFLKGDAVVMATAKFGTIVNVNYKYQTSATVSYQRVLPLTFDGTNWVTTPTPLTLQFAKANGVWVADNSVNYKLTAADYTQIKTMPTTVNIQTALDNVANFGDFNISVPVSPTTGWTDAQVNAAIVLILAHDFPAAVANQKYIITYLAYNGSTFTATKTFVYNGTTFVAS